MFYINKNITFILKIIIKNNNYDNGGFDHLQATDTDSPASKSKPKL